MVFDPGTVTSPTNVTVQAGNPTAAAPRGQGIATGATYDSGPTGTAFAKSVHVSVISDSSKLTPGTDQTMLQLYTIKNGAWSQDGIGNNAVETTTHDHGRHQPFRRGALGNLYR